MSETPTVPSAPVRPFDAATRRFGRRLVLVVVQLVAVLAVSRAFDIEQAVGFNRLGPLMLGGFVIHALLPRSWRKPFFLVLFAGAATLLFTFPNAVLLIGIALGLIAICHTPIPFAARIALLVIAGGVLALFRAELLPLPGSALSSVVLPILGAMFMFRLIVYMYDLRHLNRDLSISDRLAYFFLLPNLCFPLFPVVDFRTYLRTYYDADDIDIYQKGVLWIFRGVTHLLLYRIAYHHLMPSPAEVDGVLKVALYMAATYLLYLRISGQFHIIVGVLCLFGFNLPETHRLYFLASSFNDYWRRINIYWKDFMMKILFYPSFMRLRRFGTTSALVISTLVVFAGTWLLHSYQWFWLRGTFPITWPDALFWGILGLLVAANSVYESRRTKKPRQGGNSWSLANAARYSVRVVGMLAFITVLWSLWSSESIRAFAELFQTAATDTVANWAILGGILTLLVCCGIVAQYIQHRGLRSLAGSLVSAAPAPVVVISVSVLLVAVTRQPVQVRIGQPAASFVTTIRTQHLNQRDEDLQARGYYEGLLSVDKYTSALAEAQSRKPPGWDPIMESDAVREVPGVLQYTIVPNYNEPFKEVAFGANQDGLRDKPYAREKPAGTFRIALLGASYEMGAGVPADKTFEALAEQALNEDSDLEIEILNFAVGGYAPLQNLVLARDRIWDFDPDAVVLTVNSNDARRTMTHLVSLVLDETDLTGYEFVEEAITRSGARPSMSIERMRTHLDTVADSVIAYSLAEIARAVKERGLDPVAAYVPLTGETEGVQELPYAQRRAVLERTGYRFLDLSDALTGQERSEVMLRPWDEHPSRRGHELIGSRLADALRSILPESMLPENGTTDTASSAEHP